MVSVLFSVFIGVLFCGFGYLISPGLPIPGDGDSAPFRFKPAASKLRARRIKSRRE